LARKPADQSVNREDIILAAAEVLRRNGYEAATMKDIAAAVNLTAASLYHHFRNKDTLLLAVLEAGMDAIIARTEPIACSERSSAERLREMIRTHIISLTGNTAVGAAMVFEIRTLMNVKPPPKTADDDDRAAYEEFSARREAFFARRDEFERLFRQVVREGIERGEFRRIDAGIYAKTLLGAHNWVGVWYRPDGRLSGAEIADMMADALMGGVVKD
jgi:TetR/AcrR family transcriptional regulator, cholesterol catabolism regulator